jgi:hypothetical protein
MGQQLAHIARCLDLSERDVAEAVTTREGTRALLEHLARVSAPNTGTAKLLLVCARMATSACDWVDGDLSIHLESEGDLTVVNASTELGGGLRERLFTPIVLKASLEEFTRAIERVPHMIAPLGVRATSPTGIVLTVSAEVRRTSLPPPSIEIAADSLFVRVPAPPPPSEKFRAALPVVTPGVPVVEAAAPKRTAPGTPAATDPSQPPPDVDGGWDE